MDPFAAPANNFSTSADRLRITGGISPETREQIDKEVQRLVTGQYERAQALLTEHHAALKTLAGQLLEHETVDGSAVRKALAEVSSIEENHAAK